MISNYIKNKEGKNLSKSDSIILEQVWLRNNNVLASEITSDLHLSSRSVHYSLNRLVQMNILKSKPNLKDLRKKIYFVPEENIKEVV